MCLPERWTTVRIVPRTPRIWIETIHAGHFRPTCSKIPTRLSQGDKGDKGVKGSRDKGVTRDKGVRSCDLHRVGPCDKLPEWPDRFALNSKARCITSMSNHYNLLVETLEPTLSRGRFFAVIALAHDDLLVRTAIMAKFQLSVVRFQGRGTGRLRQSLRLSDTRDLAFRP